MSARVRLRIALSPGAAERLEDLAAAEGTDISGIVEFLVRARRRPVRSKKLEPEQSVQWIPGPPPPLRDPTNEDAPETIRHLARLVDGGSLTDSGKAALKAWMLGDDDALRLLGTPVDAEVAEVGINIESFLRDVPEPEREAALAAVADGPKEGPPLVPRDPMGADAPSWVRDIVNALTEGLDALVPEEAMETLRAWKRGEDVTEPDLSALKDD